MTFKKQLLVAISLVFLSILSLFLFRDSLLNYIIRIKQHSISEKYHMDLLINKIGFSGIRDIYIEDLSLTTDKKDPLIIISRIYAKLSISKLLKFSIGFKELFADTVLINAMEYDSISNNFSGLLNKGQRDKNSSAGNSGFREKIAGLFRKVDNLADENVLIQSIRISYTRDKKTEYLSIPELIYNDDKLKASLITSSFDGISSYVINGKFDHNDDKYDLTISKTGNSNGAWPFIDLVDHFQLKFDNLHISLKADADANVIPLNIELGFVNLIINHWRISPVDVVFNNLVINFKTLVDDSRFSIDKGSYVSLAKMPIYMDGYYEKNPGLRIAAHVLFNTDAEVFFSSLPKGMFNTLQGLKASGNLKYTLDFDLDKTKPDDVVFESLLKKDKFKILQFGTEYFPLINNEFQFTAMDKDRPVRSIFIGSTNPMYTPLELISDNLRNAVLSSEDPGFMTHNGFVESAFRESIATNVKEGRFARGGSTISMQLVKNLFLSRNKTISRKLEEALIVWLIEQNRLISKERMFEVYLNIIEWGPDKYGIGEASQFYFNKKAADLNLSESIFLASIIPHPKYYKYMFDSSGTLKVNQQGFYGLIASRLLKRNLISQDQFNQLVPSVKLNGDALKLIVSSDSIPIDSLKPDEIILME